VPASAALPASAPDRQAARAVASHPEQGWSLLGNGVVALEDADVMLPGGRTIPGAPPARQLRPRLARSAGRLLSPTARLRLTLFYAALFLVSGAGLLAMIRDPRSPCDEYRWWRNGYLGPSHGSAAKGA
jgi:uncharacterized protein DUF5999